MVSDIINEPLLISVKEFILNMNKKLRKIEFKLKRKKLRIQKLNFQQVLSSQIITVSLRRLFNLSPLSQILDEINSITEITHKRKIAFKSIKDSNSNSSNLEVREIHSSHFGKICPVETTEGKNAGLIWSLSKEARINEFGFIETPFFM